MNCCISVYKYIDNMVAATKSFDFAQKAIREADKLWSEGVINENTIEEWKHEHMRIGC